MPAGDFFKAAPTGAKRFKDSLIWVPKENGVQWMTVGALTLPRGRSKRSRGRPHERRTDGAMEEDSWKASEGPQEAIAMTRERKEGKKIRPVPLSHAMRRQMEENGEITVGSLAGCI